MTPQLINFKPIYQTRVWGGRTLETRFERQLPDDSTPFGESWEISAREEADSVVCGGELDGKTLTELWADPELRKTIFGAEAPDGDRFPLLCKILDCREKLSIQVHPPAEIADKLGGEPKTEVWYIADADPGAEMYVGVKKGIDKAAFRKALEDGTAEEVVHCIRPEKGDYIFIESGRLHAIGAGLLIYEIQQNSDTTYRVYDWNRMGLDGKPRQLHVEQSMQCIDFSDVEPGLDSSDNEVICECEYFKLEEHKLTPSSSLQSVTDSRFAVITVVDGILELADNSTVKEGDFFITSKGLNCDDIVAADGGAKVLLTTWGDV